VRATARRWWLSALLLSAGLCACIPTITTPLFSTADRVESPRSADLAFLDQVELATTSSATNASPLHAVLARVRGEMEERHETRYWAANQLLVNETGRHVTEPFREVILETLVETDDAFHPPYVSARVCAQCHPKQFDEWSASPHAYAQLSPIFNAMQGKIGQRTNGTNGDFCIRCHTQIGMNQLEPTFAANASRSPVAREGVTCVICHRIQADYGKVSGRVAFAAGMIFTPVQGPTNADILEKTIEAEGLNVDPNVKSGTRVHKTIVTSTTITKPGFCGMCHDVTLGTTFRLEEAFSDFKSSPAAARGATCQDCHMGSVPGEDKGFDTGPAAIVNGRPTPPRRITNHMMPGPDYSIVHPGLYPQVVPVAPRLVPDGEYKGSYGNPDDPNNPFLAELTPGRYRKDGPGGRAMPIPLWLDFDARGDWGRPAFEKRIDDACASLRDLLAAVEDAPPTQRVPREKIDAALDAFPDLESWGGRPPRLAAGEDPKAWLPRVYDWLDLDEQWWAKERRQARSLLEFRQFRLMAEYRRESTAVLRAGFQIAGIDVSEVGPGGIELVVHVKSGTDGHNVPTGFQAERSVFLQVQVTAADGALVFASGDTDPNGDLRDEHSVFVRQHEPGADAVLWEMAEPGAWRPARGACERDPFLFSLQSRFVVHMNRGGEREQVLAVNRSIDALPFLRPPTRSNILTGAPADARIHRRPLTPLHGRDATYTVSSSRLEGHPGPYRARVRLVSQMVPVNLVMEIQDVGFDYGMSALDIARNLVNGYEADVVLPTGVGAGGLASALVDGKLVYRKPTATARTKVTGRIVLADHEAELRVGALPLVGRAADLEGDVAPPIAGATVTVRRAGAPPAEAPLGTVETDAQGHFAIPGVPSGPVAITLVAAGRETVTTCLEHPVSKLRLECGSARTDDAGTGTTEKAR
jgi:hypothetical protein